MRSADRSLKARLVAVVFGWLVGAFAFADALAPDTLVKQVSEEVLQILKQNPDVQSSRAVILPLVREKVLPHFDFNRMTMLAVGPSWRGASAAQQQQLIEEFKTLLVRTYSTAFKSYNNQTLEFQPMRPSPDGKKAIVRSLLHQPSGPVLTIDYRMAQTPEGWKVYDVAVDGVSLVTTYRDSFAQEISSKGLDGLVKMLANKNAELAGKDGSA